MLYSVLLPYQMQVPCIKESKFRCKCPFNTTELVVWKLQNILNKCIELHPFQICQFLVHLASMYMPVINVKYIISSAQVFPTEGFCRAYKNY